MSKAVKRRSLKSFIIGSSNKTATVDVNDNNNNKVIEEKESKSTSSSSSKQKSDLVVNNNNPIQQQQHIDLLLYTIDKKNNSSSDVSGSSRIQHQQEEEKNDTLSGDRYSSSSTSTTSTNSLMSCTSNKSSCESPESSMIIDESNESIKKVKPKIQYNDYNGDGYLCPLKKDFDYKTMTACFVCNKESPSYNDYLRTIRRTGFKINMQSINKVDKYIYRELFVCRPCYDVVMNTEGIIQMNHESRKFYEM